MSRRKTIKIRRSEKATLRDQRNVASSNSKDAFTMATQLKQPPHGSPAWFYGMVERAAASPSPLTEIADFTPTLAAELLKNNPNNRLVRVNKVSEIADDIRENRWVFNGEPIIISREGLLNDGQHRANAVIEANQSIRTLIVFGVDRESRVTVDQGTRRAAGDYLAMEGVANSAIVASAGRWLIAYQRTDGRNVSSANHVTNGEILLRFVNDPLMARAATFATTHHRHYRKHATPQVIAFCYVLFSRICPSDAETYLLQVCIGEGLKQKQPAFTVREALLRERITSSEKAHLIFRGWNAFRQKRNLAKVAVSGEANLPALV